MPVIKKLLAVGKHREAPLKEAYPLTGLFWSHPQPVLASRGFSCLSRGHCPEFIKILRNNNQTLSSGQEPVNGSACRDTLLITSIRHTPKYIGVDKNHSPSFRL